jgi:hypothetical protein
MQYDGNLSNKVSTYKIFPHLITSVVSTGMAKNIPTVVSGEELLGRTEFYLYFRLCNKKSNELRWNSYWSYKAI